MSRKYWKTHCIDSVIIAKCYHSVDDNHSLLAIPLHTSSFNGLVWVADGGTCPPPMFLWVGDERFFVPPPHMFHRARFFYFVPRWKLGLRASTLLTIHII